MVHVRHTFFCRADDIFEKTVEQSRFEQMHFEQLTLTRLSNVCYWIKNRLKNIKNQYIIVMLILAIKIIRDLSLLMGFRTTN